MNHREPDTLAERLDAEIAHAQTVIKTAPDDASDFYDIDGIKERLDLLQTLRAERAAHQATRDALDSLEICWYSGDRAILAMDRDAYDALRQGSGEGAGEDDE